MKNIFNQYKDILLNIESDSLIIVIVAAFLVGLCVLFLPLPFSSAIMFLFLILFMLIKFPKSTVIILGFFLVFQDLIAFRLGTTTLFGLMLKRAEEVIILSAFSLLLLKNTFYRKKWEKTNIDVPLLCLILIAILSSVKNHIVPYKVAGFDLFLLLKGFFVFYICYNFKLDIKELHKITNLFFVIALTVLLLGIVDLIAPSAFRALVNNQTFIDYRFGIPSVQSIFVHPGVFGWFMAFFSCFAFAFFLILKKKSYLFFSILFILGALLSMRLKPIIGLLSALSVLFILISGAKKVRIIFIIGLLILLFSGLFGTRISMLFEERAYTYLEAPDLSKQARNVLYSTSLRIAKDFFPLGSGLGTFGGWIANLYYSPLYSQYGLTSIYGLERGGSFLTDTFWPYITGQLGIIGIICFVWILISIFRNLIQVFRRVNDSFLKAFALGTLLVLVEALIESIADPIFLKPPQHFFIFASLGIACSLIRKKETKTDENPSNQ